jgi:hypothetical protein
LKIFNPYGLSNLKKPLKSLNGHAPFTLGGRVGDGGYKKTAPKLGAVYSFEILFF